MEILSVEQRKMEHIMLSITLRNHKRNTWIRHQTGVNDIIDVIKKGIHDWARHLARFKDNLLMDIKSDRVDTTRMAKTAGKTKTIILWRDNLIRHLGPAWPRIARDRCLWRQLREGCLLTE